MYPRQICVKFRALNLQQICSSCKLEWIRFFVQCAFSNIVHYGSSFYRRLDSFAEQGMGIQAKDCQIIVDVYWLRTKTIIIWDLSCYWNNKGCKRNSLWWFDVFYFIFFFFLHLLLFTCIKEIKEQRDRERETNKQRENDDTIQSYSLLTFCCCKSK